MTPEAQRIAIAEACGWQACRVVGNDPMGRPKNTSDKFIHLPDYLNDLNAMHEAENMLPADDSAEGHWGYIGHLIDVVKAESMEMHREVFIVAHATAAQRAEAFLRTIGKWEDSKP